MNATLRKFPEKASVILGRLADTLFPPRCGVCKDAVAKQGKLCAPCWGKIHFISAPYCHKCGLPFGYPIGEGALCGSCLKEQPAFTQARAVCRYDAASKRQILAFKYQDYTQLAPLFGEWLARVGGDYVRHADMILPVPLHYRRLLMRRYNQSALLAHAFSRFSGIQVHNHVLTRKRATPTQAGLTKRQRDDNMRGAFAVKNRSHVKGKTILLIDDVMTTGATLNACARVLRDAGARDVYALTLARTVLEG